MAISKRRFRTNLTRQRRRHQARKFHFENLEERRLLAYVPAAPELGIFVEQGGSPTSNGQVTNITPNNRINGAIESVLTHPTNPDVVYVGSINGGIWRTDNATAENPDWVAQTDDLPSLSIGAVEFDTEDSFFTNPSGTPFETLVAGTGNFSSFGGAGGSIGNVYVSHDRGDTWADPGSNGLSGVRISGIASKELANTIVVSGDRSGIYRSTDGGANFVQITDGLTGFSFNDLFADLTTYDRLYTSNASGIFRSDDFGLTWNNISQSSPDLQGLLDGAPIGNTEMVVHPESGRLFIGIVSGGQPVGLFHTNTGDTASPTWVEMDVPILPIAPATPITGATNTSPVEIEAIGHGLEDDDLVLVNGVEADDLANGQWTVTVVDDDNVTLNLSDGTAAGVYEANTGQITKITNPSPTFKDTSVPGSQGRIHFSIGIDPNNEDIVYIGGDRQEAPFPNVIGATNFSGSIFRGDIKIKRDPLQTPSPQWDHLTDDSNAFDPDGGTANGSAPHADSRDIAFDANGNLLEVNDGGIYRRTSPQDNTGIWQSVVGTLGVFEYHDIVYDSNSNVILAGTQDNGTQYQLTENQTEWSLLSGGDGGDVVVDNVTLAADGQSIRYSSSQNLGGFRSTIWDADNNQVGSANRNLIVTEGDPLEPTFDTSVVLNALDPTRLLIGGSNGVYESFTQGDSIVQTSTFSVPGSVANPLAYGGRSEIHDDNPGVIYAGDSTGDVHVRKENAGAYQSNVNLGGTVRDVRINPTEWWDAVAIASDTVVRTTDAGDTWDTITGNLSAIGASVFRSLEYVSQVVDTTVIEALVLGTNSGVYAMTFDAVGSWFQFGSNLANAPVYDMDYDLADDVLVLGTLGRGAWKLDEASTFLSPTVTLEVDQTVIAEDGVSQAIVTANLSRSVDYDTTINLAYSGTATLLASALNPQDYQTTAEISVVIPAGATTNTFVLSSRNDDLDEFDETIIVGIDSVVSPLVNNSGDAITIPATELGEQEITVTITDDPNDLPPEVSLVIGTASDTISEPDPNVAAGTTTVRAELSQATSHEVIVTLVPSDSAISGGATFGVDYSLSDDPNSLQLLEIVIPAGLLFAEKTITVIDDSLDEFDESLTLTMDTATFATLSADDEETYTVIDDDASPTVLLTATPQVVENGGTGTFTATLSAVSGRDVTVTLLEDSLSSATSAVDYTAPATLEIVISAGSLSGSLDVTAQDDLLDEDDETVVMRVSSIVNADSVPLVVGDHIASVTIVDDDLEPTISIAFDPESILETAGTSQLQATLSAVTSKDVFLTLDVAGTATGGGIDYQGFSSTITVLAGQLSGSQTVDAVGDAIDELDETVIVSVASATNAVFATGASTTLTIQDDDLATPPEIDDLSPLVFNEDELDAALRTVALTGINAGNGENQSLRVTATSSDPTLFADPVVTYTSSNTDGSILVTPAADRYGTGTVSVTVEKSGPDNDFATTDDNLSVTKTFQVTVSPVNDAPSTTDKTLTAIEDTALRITAAELFADSLGDADPLTFSPQDESNQTFRITAIDADGTEVTGANATAVPFALGHGRISEVNFNADGHLIDLVYQPDDDFSNSAAIPVMDSFGFTVEDDGMMIDPNSGAPVILTPASVEATASILVAAVNDAPELDAIANQIIGEDAPLQSVALAGINAGGGETQNLRVTATSSDPALVPNPSVNYASDNSTGLLEFAPAADRYGTATITVTVEDAGLDNILGTLGDNLSVTRTFEVVVDPVNDAPSTTPKSFTTAEDGALTITASELIAGSAGDAQPEADAPQDESNQAFGIVAIDAGGNSVTASNVAATAFPVATTHGQFDSITFDASGNLTQLVYTPGLDFNSGDDLGSLILDSFGFTVQDDGLAIAAEGGSDIQMTQQTVDGVAEIMVTSVNDAPTLDAIADINIVEDSPLQTIAFAGVSAGGGETQDVRITATSSDTSLFADPNLTFQPGDSGGTLEFTPIADRYGTATITVTVEDAGPDGDLETAADNSASTQTFLVTVSPENDLPATSDKSFDTVEDSPLTITAQQLFADSVGDANPLAPSPQDESNQAYRITSIEVPASSITSANGDSGPFATPHGQIDSVRFDQDGFLIDLVYSPGSDFDSTSVADASGNPVLDSFGFTVQDDGLAIDPAGGPDLVTAGQSILATASIFVSAVNDDPVADDLADVLIEEDSPEQTVVIGGINAGGSEPQQLQLTASIDNTTLLEGLSVIYTQGDSEAELRFTPKPEQIGTATISVTLMDGGLDNNLATAGDNASVVKTFVVTVNSVNDSPTLDELFNRRLNEDGRAQDVSLSGISAGGNEIQGLSIAATSDNPTLIADPTIVYDGSGSTATLSFVPLANQSGTATITVQVTDAGDDNDLSTTEDNVSFNRTFVIEVVPLDDPPSVSPISDLEIVGNAAEVTVAIAGISAGINESQPIRITATSDNPSLILDPAVTYSSPDATGELIFAPQPNQFGTSVVTVTVEDAGLDGDLATLADNLTATESFTVTVSAINDPPTLDPIADQTTTEDSITQSVNLTGISAGVSESQTLRVTATSGDITLLPDPTVTYVSPAATSQIDFTPVADQFGSTTITVTVEDGGEDGNLGTAADNLTTTQTFTVVVTGVNDAPIARGDAAVQKRDLGPTSILPLSNDEDIDSTLDVGSFVVTQAPEFGTLTQQTNSAGELELIYSPSDSFTGSDSLEYTIADDLGLVSQPAVVSILPDPAPLGGGDFGGGVAADAINIDVLANDVPISGQLDLSTLTIVRPPTNGTASIGTDHTITYSPEPGYVGTDSFTYAITDTDGNASEPVTVELNLVASGLRNPRDPFDVDASGEVTALDALLVINRLIGAGSESIPVSSEERGPNFFDVDDSQEITSLDALLIVNRIGSEEEIVEQESLGATFAAAAFTIDSRATESSVDEELDLSFRPAPSALTVTQTKLADVQGVSVPLIDDGLVSLLANDSSGEKLDIDRPEALVDLAIRSVPGPF